MKIEELGLTVRTYNCLKRRQIDTVEQLAALSDDDLMEIRNFGVRCLEEVHRKLDKLAVPRPSIDNPNIMERCFHNGEQNMKEKIISVLMENKTKVKGICHAHVVEIIRIVEGL